MTSLALGAPEPGELVRVRGWSLESIRVVRRLTSWLAGASAPLTEDARDLLSQLVEWAERHAEAADSKADALVADLTRVTNEDDLARVIVFTEYRDTQVWLAQLLQARELGGERLGLLYGGMDPKKWPAPDQCLPGRV